MPNHQSASMQARASANLDEKINAGLTKIVGMYQQFYQDYAEYADKAGKAVEVSEADLRAELHERFKANA